MYCHKAQYTYECALEADNERELRRLAAQEVRPLTGEFNRRKNRFIFLAKMTRELLTVCYITEEAPPADYPLEYLCSLRGVFPSVTEKGPAAEICFTTLMRMAGEAEQTGFIREEYEITRHFSLHPRITHSFDEFDEYTFDNPDAGRGFCMKQAENCMADTTLLPELERIFAGTKKKRVPGFPVHYMLHAQDEDIRTHMVNTLATALITHHRTGHGRMADIFLEDGTGKPGLLEDLCRIMAGGILTIYYACEEEHDDAEDTAVDSEKAVEDICDCIRRYKHRTQFILVLPLGNNRLESQFEEFLGNVSLVHIREEIATAERAAAFLKSMARKRKLKADEALLFPLRGDDRYTVKDLKSRFDRWADEQMKTVVYPQYRDIRICRERVKSDPQGVAWAKLEDMVGLTDAKAVIRKAVNYYKIRKLYDEKGIAWDNPAMHMIFTGNPGTAKTTAARLFARIMRDNGILSSGHLVEVGRGDLVGKYVGWTAKTVSEKFMAARGGVLFIDEAYSLVDDRDGSFGDEAIHTIVQEMENQRENLVVIFAGYPDKMERFLQKNPGLRSRIAFHVPFADYSVGELCDIARRMGRDKGLTFTEDALEKLLRVFEAAGHRPDFGNGRFVRNVLEQARMNQVSRLMEGSTEDLSSSELTTITARDIEGPVIPMDRRRIIGFGA